MNRYPVWKYVIVVIALLVGAIYTLPNFFGEAPAVQVSAGKSMVRVDAATQTRIEEALKAAGLTPDYVSFDGNSVKARFDSTDNQLKGKDALQKALNPDPSDPSYVVALNLVSRSPTWLSALHASPMYLGLDLRGGVHFMLQVDMKAALDQKTESLAAYGQVQWPFTERWRLNAGLRYTDESKAYRDSDFTIVAGGASFPFYSGLSSRTDMSMWSGKLGIDFTPTDAALLYANVSKGFKSGGIFGGFPTSGDEALVPYDPETVYAYEIGFKSQWLGDTLRVNGAGFFYDYRDVQGYITVFSEVTQTVISRLSNQGNAEHEGAELEVEWQPSEQWRLQAGAAWLDAEITDSDRVSVSWLGTVVPIEGFERGFAPRFSYSLLGRYEVPIGSMRLALQADYNWRDDRQGASGLPLSVIEKTMYGQLESYGLLGARVSLQDDTGQWEVAVFGSNLTDEDYWANVTNDDLANWMAIPGRPRSYGIQLGYHW